MIEDFDKIIENLDGGVFFESETEKKTVVTADAEKYSVDLESLEKVSYNEKTQLKAKEDWHNLDVRLIDIINSFISTSERPVFLIRDDKLVYMNQAAVTFFEIGLIKNYIDDSFFKLIVKEDWNLLSKNIGEMITDSKEVVVRIKNNNKNIINLIIDKHE